MSLDEPTSPEEQNKGPFQRVGECLYRNASTGNYYAFLKSGSKQFRRSLKTKDFVMAKRRLAETRAKLGRVSDGPESLNIRFEELAKRWLENLKTHLKASSQRRREVSSKQLIAHFGPKVVRNISRRDCDAWAQQRAKDTAPSTYNNERETLRSILELAKRDGLFLDNPADHLPRRRMEKRQVVIPTRVQFRLLVDTIRRLDVRALDAANLVELLAYSGMRLGEAIAMVWRDIDFENDRFVVTGGEIGTKNHEARTVPLFPSMKEFLLRLREEQSPAPEDLVIPIGTAKKALESACRKAKLPNFTHHAMRHYFVSNAIEVQVDFKTIASWVGHKDGGILVAKTYGHLRDSHSQTMAMRMKL